MDIGQIQQTIEQAWEARDTISTGTTGGVLAAVEGALDGLDAARLRVAQKIHGAWVVHDWLKKAFRLPSAPTSMKRWHASFWANSA